MSDHKSLLITPEAILTELVARPSLNPEDTQNSEWVGETRVAEWMAAFLEERGFTVEWTWPAPDRPNILATYGPADGRRLLIEGHMDTVGVEGMTVEPFALTRDGNRLYGRGACDTKGPTAAALAAFDPETLAHAAGQGVQVAFAGAYGEEKSCLGAKAFAEAGLTADVAMILEPTGNQPVIAHKGCAWIRVEARGVSCHASRPDLGDNALERAFRVGEVARRLVANHCGHPHELLGEPTYSLGTLHGGKAPNVVPDAAVAELDIRLAPGWTPEEVLADLAAALDSADRECVTLTPFAMQPAYVTSADSPGVRALCDAVAASGREPAPYGTTWFSDAGPLSANIQDALVFGPGDIGQAHTVDEWIDADELAAGAEIIRGWIRGWSEAEK